jgi:hypothetical protein
MNVDERSKLRMRALARIINPFSAAMLSCTVKSESPLSRYSKSLPGAPSSPIPAKQTNTLLLSCRIFTITWKTGHGCMG